MPTSVKLMTQRVSVTKMDVILLDDGDGKMSRAYGMFDESGPTIQIAKDQGPDHERKVFVHENLHLMLEVANLDTLLDKFEEDVVTRLAPVLLSWLVENKAAVAYLQERV